MTWWTTFFDDDFAEVVLEREDDGTVARTVAFFEDVLGLAPGMRVFDQCCGTGRLVAPLVSRGLEVVGVDIVPAYAERARARGAEIHHADAATFVPPVTCDAGFNWWTGFGFDEDDRTSRGMLASARKALRPGGRFALDYPNVPRVLAELETEMSTSVATKRGRVTIVRRSEIDERRQTLEQDWTYVFPDGRERSARARTRLHRPADLVRFFEEAGFTVLELAGDLDRSRHGAKSARCIVLGEARS